MWHWINSNDSHRNANQWAAQKICLSVNVKILPFSCKRFLRRGQTSLSKVLIFCGAETTVLIWVSPVNWKANCGSLPTCSSNPGINKSSNHVSNETLHPQLDHTKKCRLKWPPLSVLLVSGRQAWINAWLMSGSGSSVKKTKQTAN